MKLAPGARLEVTGEIADPYPLEVGTLGTVRDTLNPGTQFEQVLVDWDGSPGRRLFLTPEDYHHIRVVAD